MFMRVAVAIIANATTGVCLSTEIPSIPPDAACQELVAVDFSSFSRKNKHECTCVVHIIVD